jgi:hypothetical protein
MSWARDLQGEEARMRRQELSAHAQKEPPDLTQQG